MTPPMRTPRSSCSLTSSIAALAFAAATLGVTFVPATARADEPSAQDIAQARQLGQQAKAAFDAGNYAESEKLWAAAQKLYPVAPTLTLGLARTQAKLGKYVAAQESYNKIIREWGDKPAPSPAFKDAAEAAKTEVGTVSPHLASVVINVTGAEGPTVTIDGDSVPSVALGLKRPVDPGQHVVKANAEGYLPAETTFTVAEGASAEANITLEKDPAAAVAPPANATQSSAPPAAVDTKGGNMNRTLAIAAWGVGGAGLVFGAVTGVIALGKHGDLEEKCPGGTCASSVQSDVDSFHTMGTLSTVGFVVAGVGAAAGAVLWFTAPKKTTTGAATPGFVTGYVGPASAGVAGRF